MGLWRIPHGPLRASVLSMMDEPTVSVVIPSYGDARYLSVAVESALAQTVKPVEIIIVDDASPVPIATSLNVSHPSVRVLRQDQNAGANAARNRGICVATGTHIAFLDDDDVWLPQKLEKQLAALRHQNGHLCLCGYRVLNGSGTQLRSTTQITADDVKQVRLVPGFSSVLVETALAQRLMLDETLPNTQDWDFYARAVRETPIVYVPEILYEYRRDGRDTISNRVLTMTPQQLELRTAALRKHREWIGEKIFRERAAEIYLSYIGRRKKPWSYFYHSLKTVGITASAKAVLGRVL